MKRCCPRCGYDQFGHIPVEATEPGARVPMRCPECNQEFLARELQTFSKRPWWWYWAVLPWCFSPAGVAAVAPLLDTLIPGYSLDSRLTFWSLALSPVLLYVLLGWIFAAHRLARWYFGAIIASLVLSVANALVIGVLVVLRT